MDNKEKDKEKEITKQDTTEFPKKFMTGMTEEMFADLVLLQNHYRAPSMSHAVRLLIEDKLVEIKKEMEKV